MSRTRKKSPPVQFRLPLAVYDALEGISHPGTPSQWVAQHLTDLLGGPEEHLHRTVTVAVNGVPVLTASGLVSVNPVFDLELDDEIPEPQPVNGVTDDPIEVDMSQLPAAMRVPRPKPVEIGSTVMKSADPDCDHRKSSLIAGGMRKCPTCGRIRRPDGQWYSV